MSRIFNSLIRKNERLITIAGAGGKTSLMFLLARGFRDQGLGVITTTTTRILYPTPSQSAQVVLLGENDPEETLDGALRKHGHVTVGLRLLSPGNKLQGLSRSRVTQLLAQAGCDRLLVEADGARGLSLKAPGEDEPVVPPATDLFVCLVGMDIIGRSLDEKNVFRPQRTARLSGLSLGDPVTVEAVARLCVHPQGMLKGCPPAARSCIFLNKTDLPQGRQRARQVIATAREYAGKKPDFWVYGSVEENLCDRQS